MKVLNPALVGTKEKVHRTNDSGRTCWDTGLTPWKFPLIQRLTGLSGVSYRDFLSLSPTGLGDEGPTPWPIGPTLSHRLTRI